MALPGRHCSPSGKKPKMMKLMFCGMIDQQAPSMSRQASEGVFQTLSMNAQLMNGGTTFQRTTANRIVSTELYQVLNRLPCSQPSTPTSVTGGLRYSRVGVVFGALI